MECGDILDIEEITFTPKIGRSGNSFIITISPHIAEKLGIQKGDLVEIKIRKLG
jgi:antitoxin component of MazEF toxin-antitoxin module